MNWASLLAAVEPDPVEVLKAQAQQNRTDPLVKDLATVIGIGLLLAVLCVIWAAYFRKRRHHHRPTKSQFPTAPRPTATNATNSHRKRRRIRIREHRPRNPTLAETIGLPPRKPDPPPTPENTRPS